MELKIKGKKKIQGVVKISGAKNSAVAILPAALLCDEEVILRNIPEIEDINILVNIISSFGYSISFADNTLMLKQLRKLKSNIENPGISKLRGSYYFMGAFLGKIKKIRIDTPGGCDLGYRPINFHLDGFKALNVKVKKHNGAIHLKTRKLIGNIINLEFPSVGATINLLLASVKAKGTTTITNCAIEPEIVDVANFLNSMGAKITGAGTQTINIDGVSYLHKTDYTIINDRIEAGTYLILGALSEGEGITVENINPEHLTSLIDVLKRMDCTININENKISIKRERPLLPIDIKIGPFPEFPTDLGQLMTVLMTQATGVSTLTETIYVNRFSQIEEIKKMGAVITLADNIAIVNGTVKLKKATMTAHDLRGAAALILAACTTRGMSTIENIDILFRGYEKPLEKLNNLGVYVELIDC